MLRKGFFKVLGSVIQAAIDRGHRAVLLWDPDETKPGERVDAEDLRRAWPAATVVRYARKTPLLPVLEPHGVAALVAPFLHDIIRFNGHLAEVPGLKRAGIRFCSVDYALEAATRPADSYTVLDITCYTSDHHRGLHWRGQADAFARLGTADDLTSRAAITGSTMMDQLALVDRPAVRARYGIPEGRPVVLLMSLKMDVPDPLRRLAWGRRWLWPLNVLRAKRAVLPASYTSKYGLTREDLVGEIRSGGRYRALCAAIQRFAERANAVVIVKSREKNRDPGYVRRLGTVPIVVDETVYPYTSMELMAIADLCIHFQSGAVLEAAFARVPSLSIRVPQPYPVTDPGYAEMWDALPDGLQNFPGVVWPATWRDAERRLDAASLDDFRLDPVSRGRYVEKYLGFDDARSGTRVVEALEQLVTREPRAR